MESLHVPGPSGPLPVVTGLSPTEGVPGTQITIRGENLGVDQNDLLMLFICGIDCIATARWKSPSKIIARIGNANRGLGEVKIATKSGGRGTSEVKFRVFIEEVGPLVESAVWVDESRTVPGREAVRVITQVAEEKDALGLVPSKKMDPSILQREFPDASGNLRMESFSPQWYLLENHSETPLQVLREATRNMEKAKSEEARRSEQMHKANIYSLINCVDTLATLHDELNRSRKAGELSVIRKIGAKITKSKEEAENVFKDVLSRKDKADATRNALSILTRFKFIFFLSKSIDDNMKKKEYLTVLNDYTRAKSLYGDTEVPLFREVMAELDRKMDDFKEEVKHQLIDTPSSFEEQSKLIKYLKILEPDSDPAWECIRAYHHWLQDMMWDLQESYQEKALDTQKSSISVSYALGEVDARQQFVAKLTEVMITKLQAFWKLSNTYNTNDTSWTAKQDDINQMLANDVNVSSWLIMNALIPSALPDLPEMKAFKSRFTPWPGEKVSLPILIQGLKSIRLFIATLLENQFASSQIQPLIELCMATRLKVVVEAVEKCSIRNLSEKEDWQQEFFDDGTSKTALPDFYENEVCACIATTREALSSSGFPGESCMFAREAFKDVLIRNFVYLIACVRECFQRVLNFKSKTNGKRPEDLEIAKTSRSKQATPKRVLISICNIEYIIKKCLVNIGRRMTECGIRNSELILEESRNRLNSYRDFLVSCYIQMKCSEYDSLIKSATYHYIPDEDASDYIKEMMMCCVMQQAELHLCAPHITGECLKMTLQSVMSSLLNRLAEVTEKIVDPTAITQCVVDLCALEQAFGFALDLDTQAQLNTFRAELYGQIDKSRIGVCLRNMRTSMRLVLSSLDDGAEDDNLNTSSI